ncbi:MAG: 50S ribosomal protein L24 [Neomegalonema sp.]|nr:50S ribosomal protein L24 [Neomegalonema sp.]
MAAKLKKGDRVVVLSGKDKGREGDITKVIPAKDREPGRAVVSGVNVAIKHQKQSQAQQGGRNSIEKPIDLSNLAYVDPKDGGPTRIGFKFVDDGDGGQKKVRFAKKSGEVIDG